MQIKKKIKIKKEFPSWLSGNLTNPNSIREVAVGSLASLSGLRIRRCCELWHRLQMRIRSGIAVAVVYAGAATSDLAPNLGPPSCSGGQKRKKKDKIQKKKKCK